MTFDIDWVPDFILEDVSYLLKKHKIKATWFVTHDSPIIQKFSEETNYELGIHPNFNSLSTQGSNPREILKNLKKIVPDLVSLRSHSLFQSAAILLLYKEFGIKYEVSYLLYKSQNIEVHYNPAFNLYRIPYFWEDDVEMYEKVPKWSLEKISNITGLKIFNFHPIHVILNSKNLSSYNKMKNEIGLKNLNENNIKKYINPEKGTRDFLIDIINEIKKGTTYTIKDLMATKNIDEYR